MDVAILDGLTETSRTAPPGPSGHGRSRPLRIGFLLNHSASHQVGHALPIARALAERHEAEIEVFVPRGIVEDEVRRLCGRAEAARLMITLLRDAGSLASLVTRMSGGAVPADRISILRHNVDRFRALDALVVPEKTSLRLKTCYGLTSLKMIHTRHGAGDRAIGFDHASGRFDFVLMSGAKIRDRLEGKGLLKPDAHAIVGYPKFDILAENEPPPLFDNGRPTVLYNPHPSPALSSWYGMGLQVLEYFAQNDRFNLIFAPHVMLFAKRFNIALSPFSLGHVPSIPRRFRSCPHVHIDTGSSASSDMSYTRAADIYLGDVSSQVYEFLARPRPCIFLNPQDHHWQGNENFAHWQVGDVVRDIGGLERALDAALSNRNAYRPQQERLFSYSIDLNGVPSSQRAAQAILDYLTGACASSM